MRVVLTAVVFMTLLAGEVSAQMTQALRDTILTEHNRLRRDAIGPGGPDEVSEVTATAMLEMEYDMNLECVAQAYIETQSGGFTHNNSRTSDYAACGGSGYVGENWFSGAPSTDSANGGATRAWVDHPWPGNGCSERQNYHDPNCNGVTGHYTQVLWANTYKVGCGYTAANGTLCNYSPGGNYSNQVPFEVGAACSACPDTHPYCNDGLCSKTATNSSQAGFVMNAGLNDAWYDPVTDGQGFYIVVLPEIGRVSLAWFTYDTSLPPEDAVANLGNPGHRWLTALGKFEGNTAVMRIILTSGGIFDTPTEVQRTDPKGSDGYLTLTFDGCNSGTVEYDITSIGQTGIVPIQRIAADNIALCEALAEQATTLQE